VVAAAMQPPTAPPEVLARLAGQRGIESAHDFADPVHNSR
jgi:hypothetical protein